MFIPKRGKGDPNRRHLLSGAAALLSVALVGNARAASRPMLKVTDTSGESIEIDETYLAELPWHEIQTHTQWTEGLQTFKGPYLKDILVPGAGSREDIEGHDLRMIALNDFEVIVPASDAWSFHPILAREMNGVPMRVRDKGPLWLIYPRDDMPELQNLIMDERWIWQLSEIVIL